MHDTVAKTDRKSVVNVQLEELANQVSILEDRCARLCQILGPALHNKPVPSDNGSVKAAAGDPGMSSLSTAIESQMNRIRGISATVSDLVDRVEV